MNRFDWTFSGSAEAVIGALLVLVMVAAVFAWRDRPLFLPQFPPVARTGRLTDRADRSTICAPTCTRHPRTSWWSDHRLVCVVCIDVQLSGARGGAVSTQAGAAVPSVPHRSV